MTFTFFILFIKLSQNMNKYHNSPIHNSQEPTTVGMSVCFSVVDDHGIVWKKWHQYIPSRVLYCHKRNCTSFRQSSVQRSLLLLICSKTILNYCSMYSIVCLKSLWLMVPLPTLLFWPERFNGCLSLEEITLCSDSCGLARSSIRRY